MPLNLPDGTQAGSIVDPDGRAIGEVVRKDTGETVWTAGEAGMHLDMRDAHDYVDVSASTPTVTDGQTLGVWVKPTQLSSAGHEMYPGIWSQSTGGGGYADVFTLDSNNGAGNVVTTGSLAGVSLWIEDDAGNIGSSTSWGTFTATIGEWHLVGFHLDGTASEVEAWADGASLGTDADFGSASTFRINSIGYGYGDSTDDASGGKYMDDLTIFNRILTAAEWADWYNGTHPGGDIAHRWRMDDDSDTTTVTDTEGAADGTNNGCAYVAGDAPSA